MIENLNLKLTGELPVTREELFKLIDSWGRKEDMSFGFLELKESKQKECYDLSKLDTSKIDDLSYVFAGSLFNGDISNWNTSNVILLEFTFHDSNFNGDLSKWDTSKIISLYCTFYNNSYFNNNSLKNWNVSNVINMIGTFDSSVFNRDISRWNVSKVTIMNEMFYSSKFTGDISKWEFNSKVSCDDMFRYNSSFQDKYNFDGAIPKDTTNFLYWFKRNNIKMSNINITKEDIINIDDYLISFNKELDIIQ